MATETQTAQQPKPGKVPIYIDGTKYIAPARALTGAELRALATPPIGEDRDLRIDSTEELDELVANEQQVGLAPNMRFFTVPRVINPGKRRVA